MSVSQMLDNLEPDFNLFKSYIRSTENSTMERDIREILTPWAENKKRLWKMMDNQFRLEYEIELPTEDDLLMGRLASFYSFYSGVVDSGSYQFNTFVREFLSFIWGEESLGLKSWSETSTLANNLFSYENMMRDSIVFPENYKKIILAKDGKKVTVQNGMKPIRAIQKIVKLIGDSKLNAHFEDFRQQHSTIMTSKVTKGRLVLSIHPLDFVTMSDNANNWSSCMSWNPNNDGCYKRGTLEMMNSNNVLVAYLESNTPYEFVPGMFWSNKTWRALVVVDKDIIITGRNYPYEAQALSQKVCTMVGELAKKSFNWDYQFGPQPYYDMAGLKTKQAVSRVKQTRQDKKAILLQSSDMYNDFMSASCVPGEYGHKYFCLRNKVKKQKVITFSGIAYCLDCGAPFPRNISNEPASAEEVVCDACFQGHSCEHCGRYVYEEDSYATATGLLCKVCAENLKICPTCEKPGFYHKAFIAFHNEQDLLDYLAEHNRLVKEAKEENDQFGYWFYQHEIAPDIPRQVLYICNECHELMLDQGMLIRLDSVSHGVCSKTYAVDSDFVLRHSHPRLWSTPSENDLSYWEYTYD